MGYKTILHPSDGSPAAALATPHAVEVARIAGARLIGLYVSDTHLMFQMGIHHAEAEHEIATEAHLVLVAMAAAAAAAGVAFESIVTSGPPAVRILEVARDQQADLIVVGSHGGGALAHLLMGSVSERLLRESTLPVLVVPWRSRSVS